MRTVARKYLNRHKESISSFNAAPLSRPMATRSMCIAAQRIPASLSPLAVCARCWSGWTNAVRVCAAAFACQSLHRAFRHTLALPATPYPNAHLSSTNLHAAVARKPRTPRRWMSNSSQARSAFEQLRCRWRARRCARSAGIWLGSAASGLGPPEKQRQQSYNPNWSCPIPPTLGGLPERFALREWARESLEGADRGGREKLPHLTTCLMCRIIESIR
jgi:hypothetical protein